MTLQWINELWGHFDKYHGRLNTSAAGHYYFAMLFAKCISDRWEDSLLDYQQKYKGDKAIIERKMERERFVLNENFNFDYIFRNRFDPDIGGIINRTLGRIEEANQQKLEGIFGFVDFNSEYDLGETRERNDFLMTLVEVFARVNLGRNANVPISEVAEDCLVAFDLHINAAKGREFYTPREICNLMSELLSPKKGDSIYDPTCGTGGFLLAASRRVADETGRPSRDYALYGQEKSKQVCSLAKMNLYLHDLDSVYLSPGDAIVNPEWKEDGRPMKFDIVASQIPFSVNAWGMELLNSSELADRFHWGIPPSRKGDYAFIEHILGSINYKGRAGVLVPQGVLFREGREQLIRRNIIDQNLLEAVIGLPANLLFHTGIPCAILLFNKDKGQQKDILFINAAGGFESGKRQNRLLDEHINKIVRTYRNFKKSVPAMEKAFSRVVRIEEIVAADYNLNISRYFDGHDGPAADGIDVPALEAEIAALEKDLAALKRSLEKEYKDLKK
jgi:type I restriction enzyme M protein